MQVASLHIYPVKSCRGTMLASASLESRGFAGDRRAMIVDETGRFISQRSHGQLAQIKTSWRGQSLFLEVDGAVFEAGRADDRVDAGVWRDQVDVCNSSAECDARLSQFIGQPVRLVFMDEHSQRQCNPEWADSPVSLADGYPYLITNTASLDALNVHLDDPVTMARFRPNIAINHDEPWAEDGWKSLKIGDCVFDLVKPCTRCEVTNLDPVTGDNRGDDVTRTLARYRRSGDKRVKGVLFGWNAIARGKGIVRKGDPVEILETRAPWPIA